MKKRKVILWVMAAAVIAVVAASVSLILHHWRPGSLRIQGAVIRKDEDARKQSPVSGTAITASDGATSVTTESDENGYFRLDIPGAGWPGRTVKLSFRASDYQPLELTLNASLRPAARELFVAAMSPVREKPEASSGSKESVVSNIRIRYTVNSETEENVGSEVRTFQVVNHGNVPCNGQGPCSPDGYWKASTGGVSLDAGPGSEFRNVRASCIAGPCPFTRIDSNGFANGGRRIAISATNWSDTATFLQEAEVFHTAIRSNVRRSYPVVFGRVLNFTVPPTQEGVSIEAEIDGSPMVFPLGPEIYLSWANCVARPGTDKENSTVYVCELKPGFRF